MKKVLFVAPYRSYTGWGEAAYDYALALTHTNCDITLRPIWMTNSVRPHIPEKLKRLEQKINTEYDVVIQKVLPHLLEFSNDFHKTICLCTFETANLKNTNWPYYINQVDELWVPSTQEKQNLKESGVNIPIHNISEPIDVTKFNKEYDITPWKNYELENKFNFYFIGEYIARKNIKALLTAFHREFSRSEPVNLIIKTNLGGVSPDDLTQQVQKDILQFKKQLGLYHNIEYYHSELLITEHLTYEELYALHQICDCFVMPSYGEAFCRPAIDAMGFGNTPIVTDNTGMTSFISNVEGYVVPSHRIPVYTEHKPLPQLYTGWELWSEIDILALQKAMRQAYELTGLEKVHKQQVGRDAVQKLSYTNVGQQIGQLIK